MDRLRREAVAEHEATTRAGGSSSFDPLRPWNTAWQKATNHEAFWREEVIEPGMLILTKVVGLNDMVEGDATIKGAAASSHPRETQPAPARMASNQRQPSSSAARTRPRKSNRSGRVHQIEDGKYTLNRTGFKLCEGYQSGECSETTSGIWCAQQWDTVHQCNRCLGNHPSKSCPHKDVQVPGFVKRDKGKGSAKGKKGARELPTDKRMMSERLSRRSRGGVCMTTLTTTESSKMRWQYSMLACRIQANVNLQSWNL